ncbi:bacterial Ig-like domain [Candidatus Symbiothrix dinenymphae]|nr:bacterial Ig-like domain [Candidatus Symbiothrix dinenymphae]
MKTKKIFLMAATAALLLTAENVQAADTVRIAWTSGAKNFSYTASGNITVDWGDGSPVETFTSGSAYPDPYASVYDKQGAYTAIVAGDNLTVLEINNQSVLAVDLSKAHSLTSLKCYNNLITDGNLILNTNGSLTVDVGDNYLSAAALNALGSKFSPVSGITTQTFTSIATVGNPVTLKGGSNTYNTTLISKNNTVIANDGANYTISGNDITFLTEGAYRVVVENIGSGGSHTVNNYVTVVSGYTDQQIDITLDTKGSTDSTVFSLSASYGQPFDVDWGDGTTETYYGTGEKAPINVTTGMSPLTLVHKYTTAGSKNVSITAPFGTLLTALNANHNDGHSVFTALDVTKAPALERLLCESHNLATLDVRNNLWLGRLNCGYNRLTTLQLSTATNGYHRFSSASILVECQNNRIDTVEIGTRHDINCSNNAISLQGAYNIKQTTQVGAVIGDQNRWFSGAANVPIPLVDMVATNETVKNSAGTTLSSGSGFTYTQGTGITFDAAGYYTMELTSTDVSGGKVIYNFNVGMGVQSITSDWTAATTAKSFTLEANNRDFTVDWDDGNTETYTGKGTGTSLTLSHTYAAAGDYTVSIAAVDGSCAFYTLDLSNKELTSLTLSTPTLTTLNVSNNRLTLSQLKDITDQSGTASVTYGVQTLPQVVTDINVEHVIDDTYNNSTVSVRKKRFADWSVAAGGDYTWTQGDGKIKFNTDQWQYEVTLENAALTGASVKQTFEVGDMPSPNVKVTFRITDPTVQKPKLYVDIPAGKSITVDYGDDIQTATFTAIGTDIYDITNNISYTAAGTYTITCTTTDMNDHFTKVIIQDCRAKSITVDGSSETQLAELTIQNTDADTLTFVDCSSVTNLNAGNNASLVAVNGFASLTSLTGDVDFSGGMMSMQAQLDLVNSKPVGSYSLYAYYQLMPTQWVSTSVAQLLDDRATTTGSTVTVYKPLLNIEECSPGTDYTLDGNRANITFNTAGEYTVIVKDLSSFANPIGSIYTFVVDGAAVTVPKRTVPFTEDTFLPDTWRRLSYGIAVWHTSFTEGKDGGGGIVLERYPETIAPEGVNPYCHLFFDVEFPTVGSNTNFRLTFDYKLAADYSSSLFCNLSDTSRVPNMMTSPVGVILGAFNVKGSWQTATVNLSAAQYAGTVKRLILFTDYLHAETGILIALDNLKIETVSTYTVTFDTDGGTAVSSLDNVADGAHISAPSPPTKGGFTFGGWYKEAGCTSQWNFATDVVTANLTLYAKWLNHYTVTFNTDGGTAVAAFTDVVDGSTITAPAAPTKSGSTFVAWYKEAGLTNAWNFATDVVSTNITLYAKYDVYVTGVTLNKGTLSLAVGADETLTATVEPNNATNQGVTWVSSDDGKASVDNTGKVTAVAVGTATITVTTDDGSYTANCDVTVTPIAVTGVTLDKTSTTLAIGGQETLTPTVAPNNATNQNVTWSSSNGAVATVSNGVVTAHTAGTATITVTTADGNKTATCAVTVSAASVAVTGVTLDKATTTLVIGGQETLTPNIAPNNATNQNVTWSSSNGAVASVSNGVVTAHTAGTATITVTTADGSKTATCEVTVSATSVAVTGVTLNKPSTTLVIGGQETLTPNIAPNNATNQNVTWSSSNGAVATVSNGVVTAKAAGTATITVTTADGNKTATCTVTVSATSVAVTGVTLNKSTTTLVVGGMETLTPNIAPSNATNQNVTWGSSNTGVAEVDGTGKVTAKATGTATITVTTADGSHTATCTVTVNAAGTAIESIDAEQLAVYPNPTTGIVNIRNANGAEVQVYNHIGILQHRTTESRIDLSAYPNGVYLLKIGGQTLKVVKK